MCPFRVRVHQQKKSWDRTAPEAHVTHSAMHNLLLFPFSLLDLAHPSFMLLLILQKPPLQHLPVFFLSCVPVRHKLAWRTRDLDFHHLMLHLRKTAFGSTAGDRSTRGPCSRCLENAADRVCRMCHAVCEAQLKWHQT